ncbi:MAG: type I glyceraldehyde-3-phosphate dehydrogenase [Candidatus Pacearchaeota archaeon]|nr:type I glyceraldehyde-3-phosphate dehydrogenase [Candidatus Pacearchaeota archaeon]
MVKIAINGLGRIGRAFLKIAFDKGLNVVAVNDLASIESIVYLMKYDSVYGNYSENVEAGEDFIKINRRKIHVFSEKDPENLPWGELGVDIVVECTGAFTDREGAGKHLWAGAKKVVISAPGKNPDITVVLGVNENQLRKEHRIISMASCTTNCLAPIVKVLNDNFKIESGYMTTVHAYTNDQAILDIPHKKLRRGRAGAINLIPTTSGATTSVAEVIPELKGKLDGLAIRAPVACGSIIDFVSVLGAAVTREQVNEALKRASEKEMKGILQYSEDELVSSDIIKNPNSSIVDSILTQANGNLVKVLSWYDNEYGYSNRLVELIKLLR